MSKIEKILSIILVGLFLISISSCVTKKKLKESQELQSTFILDQTETKFTNSVQKLESNVTEKLNKVFDEKIKEVKESTSTNENESTDISVNITAEEGKEKSATVGNTTVTSNGADIKVKTTSTKALSSQLETVNKELTQSLNEVQNSLKTAKIELNEYKEHVKKIDEKIKSFSKSQIKETDKKGLNIWVWVIAIVSALLYGVYKLYGNSIVARVKELFR